MGEFYECEDCYSEAVFLHRYQQIDVQLCDQHSLRELFRDLHRMQRGERIDDHIETILIPQDTREKVSA